MKTKKQIADEAKQIADVLASEPTLVGRIGHQLALLIHDLATIAATESARTAPSRRKK